MQEINFLPKEYHEAAAKRQGKLWHLIVIALFGGIVSAATLMQVSARRHVAADLEDVEPQFLAATQALAELTQLQAELKEVAASAQLCVYLEGHWPTTQILSSAIADVPESVRLTQLHFTRQNLTEQSVAPAGRPPARRGDAAQQADAARATLLEAQRDLALLLESEKGQQSIVFLEGVSSNATELHAYTSSLAQQPLVAKAELLSLEGTQLGDQPVSTFRLRLVVRPARAKPAGPAVTPNSQATVSLTENLP